jgi:hypothetical protein
MAENVREVRTERSTDGSREGGLKLSSQRDVRKSDAFCREVGTNSKVPFNNGKG